MDERSRRVARRFELPMLVAALLVIPVIAVEQSDAGEPWRAIAGVLNWAIWVAFAVELVVMLAVVPDRWRWLRSHPLEVVIVLLTPPFLPSSLQALRALRVLRLLRLLRLAQLARRTFSLDGLRYAAILAALTAAAGGYAYSAAESAQDPPPSTWDGIWWAVSTMTTVGYGDEFPLTTLGRVYAIALMLVGIGFRRWSVPDGGPADVEAREDGTAAIRVIRSSSITPLRRRGQRPTTCASSGSFDIAAPSTHSCSSLPIRRARSGCPRGSPFSARAAARASGRLGRRLRPQQRVPDQAESGELRDAVGKLSDAAHFARSRRSLAYRPESLPIPRTRCRSALRRSGCAGR